MGKQVTRRTPEERKAQAEALHASIADQVQQLTDSDQWRNFLDFTRSFHTSTALAGLAYSNPVNARRRLSSGGRRRSWPTALSR